MMWYQRKNTKGKNSNVAHTFTILPSHKWSTRWHSNALPDTNFFVCRVVPYRSFRYALPLLRFGAWISGYGGNGDKFRFANKCDLWTCIHFIGVDPFTGDGGVRMTNASISVWFVLYRLQQSKLFLLAKLIIFNARKKNNFLLLGTERTMTDAERACIGCLTTCDIILKWIWSVINLKRNASVLLRKSHEMCSIFGDQKSMLFPVAAGKF